MTYRNLVELHRRQAERLGPRTALRFKKYGLWHDVSWTEYRDASLAAAAALIDAGIAPGDRVGMVAENRVEWLVADMAILTAAAVNVPPHAPLTGPQVHFQLNDAGIRWLIVSGTAQLDKIRPFLAQLPDLRGVVVFDSDAATNDVQSWAGFLARGRRALPKVSDELARREAALNFDSLATLMYTSGTTGNPKGVMLTHGNLLSNSMAVQQVAPHQLDDVALTWLPFSHIYARTCDHYARMLPGITVALAESPETLVVNLAEIQPTHMSSVPRFYEKVYSSVSSPDPAETARRLRKVFGPRINWLSSGGAPLPPTIAHAYHDAGLHVLQGYGLTESSPVISFNRKDRYKLESVGQPLPGVEVKIAPDGEILTRGPHVMKGYWNNPRATAEAIRDGWLYTGDLGRLDEDGFLYITGRKKEMLVLSNGKKVAPTNVEGLLLGDPHIEQAVVYGEGRNFLTALVVPAWPQVRKTLGAAAAPEGSEESPSPAVREFLEKRVNAALADVSSAEQVKRFVIVPRPFSVAAEEMTVSLKLRREVIFKNWASQLDALYTDHDRSLEAG